MGEMKMKYVIAGSGAVGGSIGAFLAKAGKDVVFLARNAHLKALQEKGCCSESQRLKRMQILPLWIKRNRRNGKTAKMTTAIA